VECVRGFDGGRFRVLKIWGITIFYVFGTKVPADHHCGNFVGAKTGGANTILLSQTDMF
jgi:hypothetical protein